MKPWMEEFIRRCLASIPDRSYQRRLAAELADHLAALSADLEGEGMPVQQAQALALERMGDPARLAGQYRAQWRRHVCSLRYTLRQLWTACLMMGLAYLGVFLLLGLAGVTYDSAPGLPIQQSALLTAGMGCALFLLPFSLGAALLSRRFQGHSHPGGMILLGLLLAWLGEKAAVLLLSAHLYHMSLWPLPPLLARAAGGADPTAPWFTPAYLVLSLAGCFLLSWLARWMGAKGSAVFAR